MLPGNLNTAPIPPGIGGHAGFSITTFKQKIHKDFNPSRQYFSVPIIHIGAGCYSQGLGYVSLPWTIFVGEFFYFFIHGVRIVKSKGNECQ